MNSGLRTRLADLQRIDDQRHVRSLINAYALDPMGLGRGLDERVLAKLINDLREHDAGWYFLALIDERAIGLAVCFLSYSTFAAEPLLNVHDLVVQEDFRGRGVGQRLLQDIETHARRLGCCKVTLEVRQDNSVARALYRRTGFSGGAPVYEFWTKPLQ